MLKIEYGVLITNGDKVNTFYKCKCDNGDLGYEQEGRAKIGHYMSILAELGEKHWILATVQYDHGVAERVFYRKVE